MSIPPKQPPHNCLSSDQEGDPAHHTATKRTRMRPPHVGTHANDLYRMYKGKPRSARKPVLMCYADGGPDWQIESQKTFYYYRRFFMKSGLDAFGMGSGGGGYSAFNPIERSWAPVSKQLSSVYLSDKLPGEDEAPIKQSTNPNAFGWSQYPPNGHP